MFGLVKLNQVELGSKLPLVQKIKVNRNSIGNVLLPFEPFDTTTIMD